MKQHQLIKFSLLPTLASIGWCACVLLYFYSPLHAESIFTWTDAEGRTHYSSRKAADDAKVADLPDINKIEFPDISQPKLQSCATHGGIDCSVGPDADGSVVCYDGFREAITPFALHCTNAMLRISEVSTPDSTGAFHVFIRNNSSVTAKSVEVSYTMRDGNLFLLQGAREIEENGFAEFVFSPPMDVPFIEKEIQLSQLEIRCGNCP
jgi:hypothetical protein